MSAVAAPTRSLVVDLCDGRAIFTHRKSRTVLKAHMRSGTIVHTSDLVAPAFELAVDPPRQLIYPMEESKGMVVVLHEG